MSERVADFLLGLRGKIVLGVNPPVYDFAWFDLWAKPVGLLGLLGFLRRRGNAVRLVDCLHEARTAPLSFGRWRVARQDAEKPPPYRRIPRRYHRFGLDGASFRNRLLDGPPPDVVLVTSGMTYWYPGVFEAVRAAREVFPAAAILLGGTYARLCPEHASKSGAELVETAPFSPSPQPPALDLYDSPTYGVLLTSRGCPARCEYCAASVLWPGFGERPLAECAADLDAQVAIPGVSDIAFHDDALLLNRENRLYPLCEHIRKNHPRLRLHAPNGLQVSDLDDRCCETLFDTRFETIRLSLEGIDARTETLGGGKAGAGAYSRAVRNLRRAGYPDGRIETYILVGLPGQDRQDVREAVRFVKDLGGRPKLAEYSPIPGTPLFETALRGAPAIADEPLLHNNSVYAPYVSGEIAPDELQELKDLARSG